MWEKHDIEIKGEVVAAQAPVVVSASRATDVPAFYADWFLARLKKGYLAWTNPFSGKRSYVSFAKMRFVVFWSKNPRELLKKDGLLDWLATRKIGCYVQFTLNDYEREGLEKGVPPLEERIETFRRLAERLKKDGQPSGVIWRFDPMLLADEIRTANGVARITPDDLLEKARAIGDQLKGYTEKMVFSFADIGGIGAAYAKVQRNLAAAGVRWREFDTETMRGMAQGLTALNRERGWGFQLATCGERIDLSDLGIAHNKCVDDELMIRRGYEDEELMRYWDVEIVPPVKPKEAIVQAELALFDAASEQVHPQKDVPDGAVPIKGSNRYYIRGSALNGRLKDAGQRAACGCAASKDIGQYNTCPHLCAYCYANGSQAAALANWKRHQINPGAETICG